MEMQNLLEWILANKVTFAMTVIIVLMFLFFWIKADKQRRLASKIRKSLKQKNVLEYLEKTALKPLCEAYRKGICLRVDGKDKTNLPASEVFSLFEATKAYRINLKLLDVASGTLVGLGLFGTFLGFVIGVNGFRGSTAEEIQLSIDNLLGGMTTAFLTSLVGMGASLIYSVAIDKPWRNELLRRLSDLAQRLDGEYYIDDLKLLLVEQRNEMAQLGKRMADLVNGVASKIVQEVHTDLTYLTEDDYTVTLANAMRDTLTENRQQTQALKSFSTDLATELNNGFDEMLSRQMQQKLLPLMESIDATTRVVVAHIDQMAEKVAAPAADMMTSVTKELRQSLAEAISGFKTSISDSTSQELENVTSQLNAAVEAMEQLPANLQGVTQTLQATMNDVKNAVAEMSNMSHQANDAATRQMQEQLNCITTTLDTVMERLQTVANGIAQTSEEKNREMTERLAAATDAMGRFLQQTVESLGNAVQTSVNTMANHVTNQQADLLALQEDTTSETRRLIETFNQSLQRQEQVNGMVNHTLGAFGQAQSEITDSMTNLQALTQEMKTTAERLSQAQTESNATFESIQRKTQEEIEALTGLINNSDQLIDASEQLSEDYVQKFQVIKEGLATIFTQLQDGLTKYSETVRTSTQSYLEGYSTSLAKVAENLHSAIERQNDATEMLSDTLDSFKNMSKS